MNWFRRTPDPILDLTFGRLTFSKTRGGGGWEGRCVFPPTGDEIGVWIPGGRKGPLSAHALWERLCGEYPGIRAEVEEEAARVCREAQVVFGTPHLESLNFFELSPADADWKWIYRVGQAELHADGQAGAGHTVFLLD